DLRGGEASAQVSGATDARDAVIDHEHCVGTAEVGGGCECMEALGDEKKDPRLDHRQQCS
ncbi:MAG: hypothetical protein ACREKM_03110, partial [Longimicrobiales bacterium]